MFLAVCIGLSAEGRWGLLQVGPCLPFFMACTRFLRYRLRFTEHLAGLPSLRLHQHEKVRLGNALANFDQKSFTA